MSFEETSASLHKRPAAPSVLACISTTRYDQLLRSTSLVSAKCREEDCRNSRNDVWVLVQASTASLHMQMLYCGYRYPLTHPARQLQYGTCMYMCSEPKEVTPKQESACGTRNTTPAEILLPPFEVNVLEEKASLRPRLGSKCSLVG
jgi:hypothetical protein